MKAVLAYVEYEDIKRKNRKAVGIHPIERQGNPYYPKDVELFDFELCNSKSPLRFQMQSHMYVYMPEYDCRHTVSLVLIASADEKIEKIESGTNDGNSTIWNCFSNTMFYCPAKFLGKKDKGEEDFDNLVPNEVTSAGVWTIKIQHTEGKELHINVRVLPSISDEDYQMMLEDLVRIHQSLALDTRGSVGFDSKWERICVDLAKQVSDLKTAIAQIAVSPKTNLFQEYSLQKVTKIKKFSPRSIQDICIKGRETVNAISYAEDYNIYEHRAIKLYLQQLKRLCRLYVVFSDTERNQTVNELTKLCEEHPRNNQLVERVHQNSELIDYLFNGKLKKLQNLNPVDDSVEFSVTSPDLDCIYDDITHWFGLYPVLVKNDNGRSSAEPIKADFNVYGTYRFDFVGVNIQYANLDDLLFFYTCIQIIKTSKAKQVKITGRCIGKPKTSPEGAKYPSYSYVFSAIDSITLDGEVKRLADFDKTRSSKYTDMLKNDLLGDAWRDDKISFVLETLQKRYYLQSIKKNDRELNAVFEQIESDIDNLLGCPLLRKLKPCSKIHVTPIFQRDSRYHKAFTIMKRYQQQLKSIDLADISKYPLRKACDIYEYWGFIKIVLIFYREYSFEICQIGNKKPGTVSVLSDDINSYITLGSYKGTFVQLYHKGLDMNVEIIYNGPLEQKDKPQNQYYPDYQLIIKKGTTTWHFCMDAKYRNYTVQTAEWKRDLIDVAKNKYIDNSKDHVDGSYILHSDSDKHPFYAGNKSFILQSVGEVSGVESYVCRIGSVDLLPQSTTHFKTLLQMMFECFIGGETGYRKKCWLCGSDDVTVKCLQTSGGFPKYHMTCKNPACKAFWVENHCSETICHHKEFGKHLNNYLEESTAGDCWLVKCPIYEHDGRSRQNRYIESDEEDYVVYDTPPLTDEDLDDLPF